MTEIIGVRFKMGGKQYYFAPNGMKVTPGQNVIVETGKGLEFGTCTRANGFIPDEAVVQPLRPVVRIATARDQKQVEDNRVREKEAMKICQQLVERHELDMKLVRVEFSFDASKIIFFFTSENRVDFRALVKDLAGIFRARIELRQIGVRDEARLLGGLGICGKPFCCYQFLDEFQPVSIKMAKAQNLPLNPVKISGTCGRLMCCLKYEQEAYEDAARRCPKQDSFVECPDGVGTITAVNLLKERVKVHLEDSTEQPRDYRLEEIRVVRSGKGKRPEDYVAPSPAELEKLRYVDENESKQPAFGDLNIRLAQYLGEETGKESGQEEKQGSGRRHRRGRGRGKGGDQPAEKSKPAEAVKAPEKPKNPEKTKQPKPQPKAAEEQAPKKEEKKKSSSHRRYYHRKVKKSGGNQE